ncbi:MAG: hypothetical protein RIG63_20465 [Coleofasciculus chthonoplastes F3-SA18-01]|uniref:hypothetical protein n=1 Tax=Coleofasciculus chthonoplastes TaxID=64178 RepID=UPI0033017670
MMRIRHRINPQTFVITLNQIAKYLNIDPWRILNWEKWHNVLWVHIQGRGGYFVSYRNLEQWIAACRTLIRFCPNREALNLLWSLIQQEAQRYTKQVWDRLQTMCQQRYAELSKRSMVI